MEDITIEFKIELKEYRKNIFEYTYNRPITIILALLGVSMLLDGIVSAISTSSNFGENHSTNPMAPIVLGLLVIFFIPMHIFIGAKKYYESSKVNEEVRKYTFSNTEIISKSLSINSTYQWSAVLIVTELKNLILIYTGRRQCIMIPKRSFSKEQLIQFRNLLKSVPGLKLELKA